MSDRLKLIRSYKEQTSKGNGAILATIVNTTGSTYRNPGAKMIIFETGESVGLLSGGCLENEIIRYGKKVFEDHKSRLIKFDTSKETDIVFGYGLGCEGCTEILLESIPEGCSDDILFNMIGHPTTDLVKNYGLIYKSSKKDSKYIGKRVEVKNNILNVGDLPLNISKKTNSIPTQITIGSELLTIAVEKRHPTPQINIIGAGPDSIPVYQFAVQLGWAVNIFDHRSALLTRKTFPLARSLVNTRPEELLKNISPKQNDYFVIMTHNFLHDVDYISLLLPLNVPYIGLLGSKKRKNLILKKLYEDKPELASYPLKNIYAPIGINISEKSPEVISLSIVTEIQMLISKNQKPKGFYLQSKSTQEENQL